MPYKDPVVSKLKQVERSKKSYEKLKDDESFRKRRKFSQMKYYGIKGDYEEIWRLYENTHTCESCNKRLVTGRGVNGKCVDHHHATGYFRHIICNDCNNFRKKYDKLTLSLLLEIHRYHCIH